MKYLIEYLNIYTNSRVTALCSRQTLIELLKQEYITIYNTKLVNPELDNLTGIMEIKEGAWLNDRFTGIRHNNSNID